MSKYAPEHQAIRAASTEDLAKALDADPVVACFRAATDLRNQRGGVYLSSHFFAALLGALEARGWELRRKCAEDEQHGR